jgi:hypothetical protein
MAGWGSRSNQGKIDAKGNHCFGALPRIPKARANTSHLLSGPLSEGHTLLDGSGQRVGEGGLVVPERIIPRDRAGWLWSSGDKEFLGPSVYNRAPSVTTRPYMEWLAARTPA